MEAETTTSTDAAITTSTEAVKHTTDTQQQSTDITGSSSVVSTMVTSDPTTAVQTSIAPCNKTGMVSCDVEDEPTASTECYLVQVCADDFDWTRHSGKTPSSKTNTRRINGVDYPVTGPEEAQDGEYYMYVEATGARKMDVARMILRGRRFRGNGTGCLQFYYNLNGFHIGTLNLYTRLAMEERLVWSMSGDQSYMWQKANVDVRLVGSTEYIFEAVTTDEFAGDIAVDSITIEPQQCAVGTFSCDMEQMPTSNPECNLVQDYMDDFDWTRISGRTPSSMQNPDQYIDGMRYPVTGPVQARGGQHYIYVEATGKAINSVARVFLRGSHGEDGGHGCLHFFYIMSGRHIGTLNLYAKSNRAMEMKIWSKSGDQSPVWHQADLDVELEPLTEYVFEAVMKGAFAGDIAIDDISIEHQRCNQNIWSCQFELADNRSSVCGMTQDSDDEFDWTLRQGSTPSHTRGTGPSAAYSGLYYIYTEASDPRRSGDVARVLTPPLAISAMETICVQFKYHMSGRHTGTLQLFTRSPQNVDTNQWELRGQQPNAWLTQRVTIESLIDSSMVGFIGDRAAGFAGDIALDDIEIFHGTC